MTAQQAPLTGGFEQALASAVAVEGWMTEAQLRRLWDAARAVPRGGLVVEIGSYRGRSTIVLARAGQGGVGVVAIDPHAGNDRGPGEIHGRSEVGERDHQLFKQNVEVAGVAQRVRHLRLPSHLAHSQVEGEVDLLHIDGAHRYAPARDDIAGWGARVSGGGRMLIHDAFSSVGVTAAQLRLLVLSRRFRYLGRTGSLAEYRREDISGTARLGNALRQVAHLPWFARNVTIKGLLTLRLRRVARLLGGEGWPY